MSNNVTNKKHTRRYALEYADTKRPGKFKRIGQSFLDRLEARCRSVIRNEVDNYPTKGSTLL